MTDGPNIYLLDTVEELAEAVREFGDRATALHEGRMEAHRKMLEAIAEHEFMVRACGVAEADRDKALHRLEGLVRRDARRAVADAGADDSPFSCPPMEERSDPPPLGFIVGFAVALLGLVLIVMVVAVLLT